MFGSTRLSNYLQSSSIHGFKYLSNRYSKIEKLFWLLFILIAACVFALLISETTSKFMSEQIVVKVSKRKIAVREIPFPSMTICPEVKIPQNFPDALNFSNLSEPEVDLLQILDLVYDQKYFHGNISRSTTTFSKALLKNSQVKFLMSDLKAEWRFRYLVPWTLILTKWGFCLNFNLYSSDALLNLTEVSDDFHYKHFGFSAELKFEYQKLYDEPPWSNTNKIEGLHLKLYQAKRARYKASSSVQPTQGYRLIFHNSDELPSSSNFQMFYNNFQFVMVHAEPEINLIDDEVRKMSIEKRNCYLEDEKKLKFFKIYTKANCEQECLSFSIAKNCGCVPFYLIRSRQEKICGSVDKHCYESELRNSKLSKCNCLKQCESRKYQMTANFQTSRSNNLFLNFHSNYFYPLVKHRSYGFLEFVAAFGGLMGLIGGLSVISLIEFGFYLSTALSTFLMKRRPIVHPENPESLETRPKRKKFLFDGNRFWCKFKKFFIEFLNRNSVHGLSFAANNRKSFEERAFWACVVILSSISCFVLMKDKVRNAELNPVSFDVDFKFWKVEDIPFPAISYCPDFDIDKLNRYIDCLKHGLCEKEKVNNWKILQAVSFFCVGGLHQKLVKRTPSFDFPNDSFVKQLEVFTRYDWLKEQSFCRDKIFNVSLSKVITRFGVCFTFNGNQDILNREEVSENFLSEPFAGSCRQASEIVPRRSFHMEFNDHRLHKCKSFLGNPMMHHRDELPGFSPANFVNSQTSRFLIKPYIITTDESLRRFDPKTRNCYFEDERPLRLFKIYTKQNCIFECQFNRTKSTCGCVKYDGIRDKEAKICNYKENNCALKIEFGSRISDDSEEVKACDCLPSCNSITYNYELITDWFEPENTSENALSTSASFYFGDTEYIAYRRYASYGTVDLLSNIGGLLGLFLGMSVLSVIETIYFFTFRLFVDLWLKR